MRVKEAKDTGMERGDWIARKVKTIYVLVIGSQLNEAIVSISLFT
jgi:hypothetical protein